MYNNPNADYNLVSNEVFDEAVVTETSSLQKKFSLCGEVGHFSTTCEKPHNRFGVLITTKDQNNAVNEGHLTIEIGNLGETVLPQNKEQFDAFYLNSKHSTSHLMLKLPLNY